MRTSADQYLAEAAKLGQVDRVRTLVEAGADIESRHDVYDDHGAYYDGLTPLMIASWSPGSNVESVQELLDLGADVSATSKGGASAIWYAAGGGDDFREGKEVDHMSYQARTLALIEAGALNNLQDCPNRPILTETARTGDPARLEMLLETGVRGTAHRSRLKHDTKKVMGVLAHTVLQVNEWTDGPDSWTIPLFAAAESGSLECVEILLEAGADPTVKSSDGKTAISFAKTTEIVQRLKEAGTPIGVVKGWSSELDQAFEDARYDVAEALIESAGGLGAWGAPGEILDRYVGVNMDLKAVQLLVKHDAPLDYRNEYGQTLLHTIAWQGDGNGGRENDVTETVLTYLIDQKLDVNAKDKSGATPLHEAVTGDWESQTSVRLLLDAGADSNVRDDDGATPLMLAAEQGCPKCVGLLLEFGADPHLKRGVSTTALSLAKQSRDMYARPSRVAQWAVGGFVKLMMSGLKRRLGVSDQDFSFNKQFWDETNKQSLVKAEQTIKLIEDAMVDA